MEFFNYPFPYNDFILPLTLNKINKHYFGGNVITLDSGKDLIEYLVSPSDCVFMKVESEEHEKLNISRGDVVIIERSNLKYAGPAAVKLKGKMIIKEVKFTKDFEAYIEESNQILKEDSFEYFGTIAYALKSEEEYYLDMVAEELFIIY